MSLNNGRKKIKIENFLCLLLILSLAFSNLLHFSISFALADETSPASASTAEETVQDILLPQSTPDATTVENNLSDTSSTTIENVTPNTTSLEETTNTSSISTSTETPAFFPVVSDENISSPTLIPETISNENPVTPEEISNIYFENDTYILKLPDNLSSPITLSNRQKFNDPQLQMTLLGVSDTTQTVQSEGTVLYSNVFTSTDIEYEMNDENLKESIILKDANHPSSFSYVLNMDSYDFEQVAENKIQLFKKGHGGDGLFRLYTLTAPDMIDSNGNTSENIVFKLEGNILSVTPDQSWLGAASYPVIIDPTIEISVLNVHSHPVKGEYWNVDFVTSGTADLTITPADQATIDDMQFTSLFCGSEDRTNGARILSGDVVFYPSWQCDEVATVSHLDLKTGNHHLTFEFSNAIEEAVSSEAFNAAYTWDGGGADANWDTANNWSTNVVPTSGDSVSFDTCSSNCDPTINVDVTVAGFTMASGYAGTITQDSDTILTIDGDFTLVAGNFIGSSSVGGTSLVVNGNFSQTGGIFTAPAGNMNVQLNMSLSSGTFNDNNGTVSFVDNDTSQDSTLTCVGSPFNKVVITKDDGDFYWWDLNTFNISNYVNDDPCTVPLGASPTTTIAGNSVWRGIVTIDSGVWTANTALIILGGTITHNGNGWDSAGGLYMEGSYATVTYAGTTASFGKDFDVSRGTFPSGLEITFDDIVHPEDIVGTHPDNTTLVCGSVTFGKVIINKDNAGNMIISSGCTVPLGANPTTTLQGNKLTNNGTITIASGTWTIAEGDGISWNWGDGSILNNGLIDHNGNGWINNQGFVNGVAGEVQYAGSTMSVATTFDVDSGIFPSGLDITFFDNSDRRDTYLTCGDVTFNDVTIGKNSGGYMILTSSSCTITGDLLTTGGLISNLGSDTTLAVQGNFIQTGGDFNGTSVILSLEGSSNTTISQSVGNFASKLNINKNVGNSVTLTTDLAMTYNTFEITSGTFDQGATFDFTTGGPIVVGLDGIWNDIGTGDITLADDIDNSGIITINGAGAGCGGADNILITSSDSPTQRTWFGSGVFDISDVSVSDMAGSITAYSSINVSNNTWTFLGCGNGPAIQFPTSSGSVSENVGTTDLIIELSEAVGSNTTVNYAVTGGTAVGGGVDYTLADGTATILTGETSVTVPVAVVDNSIVNGNKTVQITLSNPSVGIDLATNIVFTLTITDTVPTIQFTEPTGSGTQNVLPVNVEVELSAAYDADISASYTASDNTALNGVDYILADGTVTIPAGQTTISFPVTIINTGAVENKDFSVYLSSPTNHSTTPSDDPNIKNLYNALPLPEPPTDENDRPYSIAVAGDYAYIANQGVPNNVATGNLTVVDISDPSAPTEVGRVPIGVEPKSIALSGNFAYVANKTSGTVSVVNIANPASPSVVKTVTVGGTLQSIFISGTYAYTVDYSPGDLSIIDISTPADAAVVGTVNLDGTGPYAVDVAGDYAYVASERNGALYVVDVSVPTAPTVTTWVSLETGIFSIPEFVYISGNYTYVTDGIYNKMVVMDLSDPYAPFVVNTVSTGGCPRSISKTGNYLTLANACDEAVHGIEMWDISNPGVPVLAANKHSGGGEEIATLGNYSYITAGNDLEVYNLFAPPDIEVGTNNSFTYTILGSVPNAEFSSVSGSVAESIGTTNLTINLSEISGTDTTVDYAVTGGTATGGGVDYTLADGTATILAGETFTTIPIIIMENILVDGSKTIEITLSNPSGGTDLGSNTIFILTITDNDSAGTPQGSSGSGGVRYDSNTPDVGAAGDPPWVPDFQDNKTLLNQTFYEQCSLSDNQPGWYGRYFDYPRTHPDMELPGNLWNTYYGDPLSKAGNWTRDWYDNKYFRFSKVSSNLEFGYHYFPFDYAPAEFTQGHDYFFGSEYSSQVTTTQPGNYSFRLSSDDDSWLYVDGNLVIDNHGIHGATTKTGSIYLSGTHFVQVFFAERHTTDSHLFFAFTDPNSHLSYQAFYPSCEVPPIEPEVEVSPDITNPPSDETLNDSKPPEIVNPPVVNIENPNLPTTPPSPNSGSGNGEETFGTSNPSGTTNDGSTDFNNSVFVPIQNIVRAIHTGAESLAKKMLDGLDSVQQLDIVSASVAITLVPVVQYGPLIIQEGSGIGSFEALGLIVLKSFYGLLSLLGIRSRRRIWGTVYDSRTKQPIDPAVVDLIDVTSDKVVDTSITDMAGRYGFLIQPGIFKIKASKTHYEFPSKLERGDKDEIFDNLYHGETFEIKDTSAVMAPNIPMDPLAFDWNQRAKLKVINFHPRLRFVGQTAINVFYYLSFAWAAFVFAAVPSLLNFGIFLAFIIISLIIWLWPGIRLWGNVYNKYTHTSVGGLILELSHPNFIEVVLAKAKSEATGKFFLKGNEGHYILSVKQPPTDQSAEMVLVKRDVEIGKEGVFNKDVLI